MKRILRRCFLALAMAGAGLPALAANTISINFNSGQGSVSGSYGIVPSSSWKNLTGASGSATDVTIVGYAQKAAVTWSAPATYQWTSATQAALKGYLDDNANGNEGRIEIEVSNIPFACYDVIIYQATDTASVKFNPPQVNGLYYSYDGSESAAKERTEELRYGQSQEKTASVGKNVVYLKKGFSGNLKINGCRPAYNGTSIIAAQGRGGIAAIQIVETSQRWGNMGLESTSKGSITSFGQQVLAGSYDFTFGDQSGLCYKEIGMCGEVMIRELKLALSEDNPVSPKFVTISDGEKSIESTEVAVTEGTTTVYGSGTSKACQIATFRFDESAKFDASKPLRMKTDAVWLGIVAAKPINNTFSDGTYSPVFLIGGEYTPPRSIAVNFNSAKGSATAGAGLVPAATWNNITAADASATVLKLADGTETSAQLTSGGNTMFWSNATEPMLRGYVNDNGAINIAITNLPFAYYDVIVYQAADTQDCGFNPPMINGRCYSYDGKQVRTVPNDTALRYGATQQLMPAYGMNAVCVQGGFSGDLSIVGATNVFGARGCIAGIQVVESVRPPEYEAYVAEDTDWDEIEWQPTVPASGFEQNAQLTLRVSGEPTITFSKSFSLGANSRLTIEGTNVLRAADSSYADGCWEMPLVAVTAFDAPDATFGALKDGYAGGYVRTETGFSLHAQNREVISVNFAGGKPSVDAQTGTSPKANLVPETGDLFGLAPAAGTNWNNVGKQWRNYRHTETLSGAKAFDGTNQVVRESVSIAATATSTWQTDDIVNPVLRGYLYDDGEGVEIVMHGIPYKEYDVIVYGTTDSLKDPLAPLVINGKSYTFKDGATVEGTSDWGVGLCGEPAFGRNALTVTGCIGDTVKISGTKSATGGRATVSAVQIVCRGAVETKEVYSATISKSTHFKDIKWDRAFREGQLNEVTIQVDGASSEEVEIVFDDANLMLGKLTIISSRAVKFTADKALPHVGQFVDSGCEGHITYAWPVSSLQMDSRISYSGGAGSELLPAAIAFAEGGSLTLAEHKAPYYIGATYPGTGLAYAMTFADATVYANGDGGLAVGNADMTVKGTSVVSAREIVLSQGKDNLAKSNLTIKDDAQVTATGTVSQDGEQNSVIFGSWDGPSTFTLQDSGSFTAASDVLVGRSGNNHTINILGGVFSARGIRASANATDTNLINLKGGELVLGETGISSYGTSKISVAVGGDAKISSSAAMSIAQGVTIGAGKTLTLDASAGTITLGGKFVNNGTNIVASGTVCLKGGTFSGTGPFVVKRGATLDYGGKYISNWVILEEGGSVVNTGTAMTSGGRLNLKLDGNASIGGPSTIECSALVTIDFNGHELTVLGDGRLVLNSTKLLGEGKLIVGGETDGTLAIKGNGNTNMANIDLEVSSRGTLDLNAGTSLTCRDFKSNGSIDGSKATLIVKGTFDASNPVRVAKLSLADGAKLVGTGLRVSDALTLGSLLYVDSVERTPGKIADVPEGTKIDGTKLVYNGRPGYVLRCYGSNLTVVLYANNWIAFADSKGVRREGDAYVVTSAEGLAWVAASATNKLFSGTVKLGADIDLSLWNWTPVAHFSGTFDGNGHRIVGLNNTNVVEELGAAGRYPGGPIDEGYSAYGLFAFSTNAVFRNVVFADVAVDSVADSVAALVGVHQGGNLSVQNVTAESGYLRGTGRAVAGLLTVGFRDNAVGDVTVTGNANSAMIVGTIVNDDDGGNVAQIVAGTSWNTTFGSVSATGNAGNGLFDVNVVNFDGAELTLPVCNFAAAVLQTSAGGLTGEETYRQFVEANDPSSVVIDPVKRTARMLSGSFANGADNFAGKWMDTLTTKGRGDTITIVGAGATIDFWDTVFIDRNVTIDLNGNCVYALYDCHAFAALDGVAVTVKNGTIYYAHGFSPTVGNVTLSAVEVREIPGETLYDRTVPAELSVGKATATLAVPYTSKSMLYCVDSADTLLDGWTSDVSCAQGNGGTLTLSVPAAGPSGFYRVRIVDNGQ